MLVLERKRAVGEPVACGEFMPLLDEVKAILPKAEDLEPLFDIPSVPGLPPHGPVPHLLPEAPSLGHSVPGIHHRPRPVRQAPDVQSARRPGRPSATCAQVILVGGQRGPYPGRGVPRQGRGRRGWPHLQGGPGSRAARQRGPLSGGHLPGRRRLRAGHGDVLRRRRPRSIRLGAAQEGAAPTSGWGSPPSSPMGGWAITSRTSSRRGS